MISRMCWKLASKRRLCRMNSLPFAFAAAGFSFFASAYVVAIGFSTRTDLPALNARSACATWSGERVAMLTSSTLGSATRSFIFRYVLHP